MSIKNSTYFEIFTSVWKCLLLPSTSVCQNVLTVHSLNNKDRVWAHRFHLQRLKSAWPLKMEPIGCPETSVSKYYYSLRKNPEERSSLTQSTLRNASDLCKNVSHAVLLDSNENCYTVLMQSVLCVCVCVCVCVCIYIYSGRTKVIKKKNWDNSECHVTFLARVH